MVNVSLHLLAATTRRFHSIEDLSIDTTQSSSKTNIIILTGDTIPCTICGECGSSELCKHELRPWCVKDGESL